MSESRQTRRVWYKALEPDELAEGRVTAVTCGLETVCMTHYRGRYAALSNKCPHQGGPLGEGNIENGLLRCPWHGWDFDPLTGASPEGYGDGAPTFPIEVRDDGIYVAFEEEVAHAITVTDVMAETLTRWGVRAVFGMVGHSNLGLADALRRQEEEGRLRYFGIRHEGAASFACSAYGKLTGRPAACMSIAGPGATNLLTTAVKYGMDITHVLLRNDELGKISKEQRAGNWKVWETSLRNPSFAEYARLCGARGLRVERRDQLDGALAEALDCDGPSLVEIVSDVELI
jgi:nitrite reductase/ring-hydroxylating ferredoxin subunit